MEEYYNKLMKEGFVDIPKEHIMKFIMFCYLQGLFGCSVTSGYVSENTKRFVLCKPKA